MLGIDPSELGSALRRRKASWGNSTVVPGSTTSCINRRSSSQGGSALLRFDFARCRVLDKVIACIGSEFQFLGLAFGKLRRRSYGRGSFLPHKRASCMGRIQASKFPRVATLQSRLRVRRLSWTYGAKLRIGFPGFASA